MATTPFSYKYSGAMSISPSFHCVGEDIVAELGNITEFFENGIFGDNKAEVKDTAGPIIEDNLNLVVFYGVCLCNLQHYLFCT